MPTCHPPTARTSVPHPPLSSSSPGALGWRHWDCSARPTGNAGPPGGRPAASAHAVAAGARPEPAGPPRTPPPSERHAPPAPPRSLSRAPHRRGCACPASCAPHRAGCAGWAGAGVATRRARDASVRCRRGAGRSGSLVGGGGGAVGGLGAKFQIRRRNTRMEKKKTVQAWQARGCVGSDFARAQFFDGGRGTKHHLPAAACTRPAAGVPRPPHSHRLGDLVNRHSALGPATAGSAPHPCPPARPTPPPGLGCAPRQQTGVISGHGAQNVDAAGLAGTG